MSPICKCVNELKARVINKKKKNGTNQLNTFHYTSREMIFIIIVLSKNNNYKTFIKDSVAISFCTKHIILS